MDPTEMNGFNFNKPNSVVVTEQLPADSSGIINMSSPSGSSDSGSSGMDTRPTFARHFGAPGKNMNLMSKVVQRSASTPSISANRGTVTMTLLSPSPKKNSPGEGRSQNTDLFLSQFQAQMSQVKSAMDAVQNEILHHSKQPKSSTSSSGPGSSRAFTEEVVPRRGRGRGRGLSPRSQGQSPQASSGGIVRGAGRGYKNIGASGSTHPPIPPGGTMSISAPVCVRYHSQISGSNGLKMKIRKYGRRGGGLKGYKRGRTKKKKNDEDDYGEDSDLEEILPAKASKVSGSKSDYSDSSSSDANDVEPSQWGISLPEDILTNIFGQLVKIDGCIPTLVRVSKVCRLWWKVAMQPELWTSVDLSTGRVKDVYRLERNLVYLLETRFSKAQHLNIGGWSSALTNFAVDVLVKTCKDLEFLNVSGCQKLSAQNMKSITESCPNLQKLDLSGISTTQNSKSAISPSAIADSAETMGDRLSLISLANNCLANCPLAVSSLAVEIPALTASDETCFIIETIVSSLAEFSPSLQVLDLSNVTSPRRDSIAIRVEQLQQGCPLLKILRLTNTDVVLGETSLKDQAASPGFPNLEELSIAVNPKKNPGLDDSDLERIVKSSKKLRLLDVRGCTKISDSGLVRVPAWDLEHLYLSGCYATKSSIDGLELIVRKWRHSFKEIDFSWTPNEDAINLAMKALAEEADMEGKTLPLRILDLCGSSVSFESVKAILRSCLQLVNLNLASCRALPRGIKRNYQVFFDVKSLREQVLSGKFEEQTND